MTPLKINHAAVWTCIVLMHGFGFLWYGPLFGESWMAMVNLDEATMQESSQNMSIWILNSVAIVASIFALAWVLSKLNVTSGVQGATTAFILVFCMHHLPTMNANMFAGLPYGLAWINAGYSLAWLTVSGFVLGSWVKKS